MAAQFNCRLPIGDCRLVWVNRPDSVAALDLLAHPLDQSWHRETLGGLGRLVVVLNRDGDLLQVHVQAQLEHRFHWGIALGRILCCRIHAMFGLMVDIDLTLNGVLVRHTLVNPSWHLTTTTT